MTLLEPAALVVVSVYIAFRFRKDGRLREEFEVLGFLSLASWAAEEGAVSLYDFYGYTSAWSVYLGHVPVMIALIWPVIIHSAWDLSSQLSKGKGPLMRSALSAGIVFTDALLIEPVAVRAGLWTWHKPGIFGVPLIGLLGWAYFSFSCVFSLERMKRGHWSLPVIAPVGTHLLLLASWWGILRWVDTTVGPFGAISGVWTLSVALLLLVRKVKAGKRVTKQALLVRIPGALFFFTLLALHGRGSLFLLSYTLAFVPPYLLMMKQQFESGHAEG